MEKVDQMVLSQLSEKVFSPQRIQIIFSTYRKNQASNQVKFIEQKNIIQRQLDQLDERQERVLDGIESGVIELDEITQKRLSQIKASREALKIEMASLAKSPLTNNEPLRASQIDKLCLELRKKLLSEDKGIAKSYLNLLVDNILVTGETALIQGSVSSLITAAENKNKKNGQLIQVPTFIPNWRPRHESNV
jgi:site-specific DNA recombinase